MGKMITLTDLFSTDSESILYWETSKKSKSIFSNDFSNQFGFMHGHMQQHKSFWPNLLGVNWLSCPNYYNRHIVNLVRGLINKTGNADKGYITYPLTIETIKQVNVYQPSKNDWEFLNPLSEYGYYEIMEAINGVSVNPYERMSPMIVFQKLCFKLYATDCKVPDRVLQSIINTGAMMGREIIALAKEKGSTKHKSVKYKR